MSEKLEFVAHQLCNMIADGWDSRIDAEDSLLFEVGYEPDTMKDEDIVALVTPLLQELALSCLKGTRDLYETNYKGDKNVSNR